MNNLRNTLRKAAIIAAPVVLAIATTAPRVRF